MRRLAISLVALVGCGTGDDATRTFRFGPYHVDPGQELFGQCVSKTLNNDKPLYINSVDLATATGFHHSNWFWVPDYVFAGPDGTWQCDDRGYNEAVAGVLGSVIFAQSTQATHETQAFPPGAAIIVPPHAKLVAGTHLLNATEDALEVPLALTIHTIPETAVTTRLAGMSFENEALGIPPHAKSRFTLECDLGPKHRELFGRDPDFNIYYALPHYHSLGSGLTFEALRTADGTPDMIYETTHTVGDALGGTIDPPFAMAGHDKIRWSCSFDNPRDTTVTWGIGQNEMCVFLAFTDSTYAWAGGALDKEVPTDGQLVNGIVEFTHPCTVVATDASR